MKHFSQLIHPITPDDFFQNYYEKRPLLIQRGNKDYYGSLLSLKAIDDYLSRQDIEYPGLRLVKDGEELEGSTYLKDIPYGTAMFEGIVDNDNMFKFFNEGATIVVQGLDRSNKELGAFCRNLSTEIPFTFQSNTYLTPQTSRGFSAHYDTHDVLCLQISGTKKWKLYDTPVELPTKQQRYQSSKIDSSKAQISLEVELLPGDLLYVPRGLVHSAETTETTSLHITLGLFPQKWNDYIKYLAGELHNTKLFRETLPLNLKSASYDYETMIKKVSDLIIQEFTPAFLAKATSQYATEQVQKRKSSDSSRLLDIININQVDLDTIVYRRPDIVFEFTTSNGSSEVIFYNKSVKFPIAVNEALDFVLSSNEFAPKEIPNTLDDKGKLVLVKKLIKEGLLSLNK